MQIKLTVLTKIENIRKTTFYFIHNESKTILPIEFDNLTDKSIEDAYIRTLKALNVKMESINLYLYLENIYYVYLKINAEGTLMDINISINNALHILELNPTTEVYIENEILLQEGIKITKELIEESLGN